MDEAQFELAQRLQDERLQHAIANRVQYQGESADCQGLLEVRRG